MKQTQEKKRSLIISLATLILFILTILLLKVDYASFINIPSLIAITILAFISRYEYPNLSSGFVIGGAFMISILGIASVLADTQDVKMFAPAIAYSTVLPLLYAFIYKYFIFNVSNIIDTKYKINTVRKEKDKTQDLIIIIGVIAVISIQVVVSGMGFGAIIDIPSILIVGSIALCFLEKDNYKRLQLFKNYAIGILIILLFISLNTALINYTNPMIMGPMIATLLLGTFNMSLVYLLMIRPQLALYKKDILKFEFTYYALILISIIAVISYLAVVIVAK